VQAWPRRIIRTHGVLGTLLALVTSGCFAVVGPGWLALLGLATGPAYFFAATRRYWARKKLLASPMPRAWRETLESKVPFYAGLSGDAKRRFEDDVRIFLSEQNIVASQGAKLDDDTRLLIAASAATLGHGLPDWEWPSLRDIVVYPRSFDSEYRSADGGEIAGMVHAQGPILLSQSDLRMGFARPRDGHNVALHELAHVMDFTDGRADGVPGELGWVATAPWIALMANRLDRVRKRRRSSVLRDYAGTNEAELFAVAVEAFFEKPRELRDKDPELYAMLSEYFAQDPAA
jgi:Mlc titration factor MtfA (ptsG expression regulator)